MAKNLLPGAYTYPLFFAVLCGLNSSVSAQVYECNGVFTNTPCDNAKPVMQEIKRATISPEEAATKDKGKLIQGLLGLASTAKNSWGSNYLTDPVTLRCATASVSECASLVASAQSEIQNLIRDKQSQEKKLPTPFPSPTPKIATQGGGNTSIINVVPPPIIINTQGTPYPPGVHLPPVNQHPGDYSGQKPYHRSRPGDPRHSASSNSGVSVWGPNDSSHSGSDPSSTVYSPTVPPTYTDKQRPLPRISRGAVMPVPGSTPPEQRNH